MKIISISKPLPPFSDEDDRPEPKSNTGKKPPPGPQAGPPPQPPQAFPIIRAGLTAGMAAASDFVESLFIDGGASVVYGPSNCGKSFWILDLAVCVATGTNFRDELEVDQGAAVYVALEGSFGVRNRIEALKQAGRITDATPLFLCFAPVSLLEAGHEKRLAESVKQAAAESKLPCRLVILDTLARAMAGGDENKGQDMTTAVSAIDSIRAATGAHVCVVHHCGKDEARGARGHSSLRAAVDTEIEVSRADGETISTVRVTKQRDLPMGDAMPFSLESVTLGLDRRGKPVTSCIVNHEDSMMAAKPAKAGRKPTCSPEEMLRFLPAANVKEWQAAVSEETGLSRSQFYDHKRHLEAGNRVRKTSTGGLEKA
jgi:AAA domain